MTHESKKDLGIITDIIFSLTNCSKNYTYFKWTIWSKLCFFKRLA